MEGCFTARPAAQSATRLQNLSRRQKIRGKENTLTIDNAEKYFCYLNEYMVLVCLEHATGIQNLDSHLRDYHVVPAKERRAVVEKYSGVAIEKADQVRLPSPMGQPIQELGKPLSGFQCTEVDCNYISINKVIFQTHCKKEHGLRWIGDTSELYTEVKVQSFFRTGGLQRYFVVNEPDSTDEPSAPIEVKGEMDRLLAGWSETKLLEEEKAQIMDAEAAKTDKTGWFKRTGWLEHLAKRNRMHLAHQIRLPDANETKLKQAAELTELLVNRSVKGLLTLAHETRRWLKSAKQNEIDQRPMARLQNPESETRYASYIVKFVCYFLRIIADEETRIARVRTRRDDDSDDNSDSESVTTDSSAESDRAAWSSSREADGNGDSGSDSGSDSNSRRRRRLRGRTKAVDMMKDARELFCWKEKQKRLAIQLWVALDGEDKDAQMEALLAVLASFIFEPVGDRPFSSGLIHFLAVLGIDTEMDRLREAKHYSYMLAGVVYCVRVLGVEKLLPAAQRDEQTDEDRERFLLMRRKFLADGSYSPMSEIINLLAYGKFVALNAGNSGNAYWSKDKKIFYLHGQPIVINRFRTMAQELVAEVEHMLWQELLWTAKAADRFAIRLEGLVDDITFTRRGVSFVCQRDNALDGGLPWMLNRLLQSREGQKLRSSDGKWKTKQVKRYLRQVDRFLELLMVCVHVTSGQPGRGSEITTMRHRNGLLQDRNIFVMDGQVMTVVRYHKSQSQWDKPKVVPRFLPPRLGQIMVMYLAYLQPFQEYLTVEVLGGGFNDYVWADEQGPWGTDRLTRALKRETGKRLGIELHTLGYRHTAVGIGRVVVGESFSKGYQDEVGEIEEAEVDEEGEDVVELQNARTTAMGVGNYSVPIDIIKHLSVRSIEAFRPLSTMWHRFLGLDGDREVHQERLLDSSRLSGREKRQRSRSINEGRREWLAVREKERQVRAGREEEVQKAMQQVLGQEEVSFRSAEQEQAMHAVLDGQTPLVVVLPTGGGKSLLFTVPACLEKGVTIVVVPYRALIEDLVQRIRKCGIDCIEWKHGESNPAALVVVSADVAGDTTSNGNFISYAGMLQSKGLLRRVVVDECHLIFTSSDWRPKLAKLKNLRLLGCPIVLLTATLPPVREAELGESMLVRAATYIRASTVRPNTRYFVSWCKRGEAQNVGVAMCRRQVQRLKQRGEKGVVYCRSKAGCEAIAEALGCGYYHAGVVDRAERVEEWLKEGGWIVATSALGTGVDFPGVVSILHVGMPWSMTDYAQEGGRGGRAGEVVDSVIVVEEGEVERVMKQKEEELDVQAMGMFLIGSGCRRGLMSRYLDGKQVSCNDIESAGCDRCGEGVAEVEAAQREASVGWQQMQEAMEEIGQGCAVCWMLGEAGSDGWKEHFVLHCRAFEGLTGAMVDAFRRGVRDGGGSHSCQRCWVSQKYCATGQDTNNRCQWPNRVVPLARAAAEIEEGVKMIRGCGFQGELGGDWGEYALWLGKRHRERVWGEYFSNAMVVVIWITTFVQQNR
jgi:superfamily II DNA helicase RecQ